MERSHSDCASVFRSRHQLGCRNTAVHSVGGESMEEAAILHQNSDGPAALLVCNDNPVQVKTAASPNGTDDSAAANQFISAGNPAGTRRGSRPRPMSLGPWSWSRTGSQSDFSPPTDRPPNASASRRQERSTELARSAAVTQKMRRPGLRACCASVSRPAASSAALRTPLDRWAGLH
jgi:hypothetical protein